MELISDTTDEYGNRNQFFLVSRRETEDLVIECQKHIYDPFQGEHNESTKTFKKQKFLCINGPKANVKMTWKDAYDIGYQQFNCGESPYNRPKNVPKMVLIYFPPQ